MRAAILAALVLAACLAPAREPAAPPSSSEAATALVSLRLPPRTPIAAKPPLLILLHGLGSDERDLVSLASRLDGRFAVASMRAPHAQGPGRNAWFSVQLGATGPIAVDEAQAESSRRALLAALAPEVAAAGADPERVYLVGFSQGGIMALSAALTAPERVAGTVGLSCRLLPSLQAASGTRGEPVLLVHGTRDTVIPVDHARRSRARLESLGAALTDRELDMGHEITAEALALVDGWLRDRLDSDGPRR
jgi:phospholipase/carboxylesterase